LLGGHDPEGETGVNGLAGELVGGGHPALGQRAEASLAREAHAVVDGVECPPVEQVGGVHGVPRLPQLVGERLHSVGQPLDVVVQHDLRHLDPS
jgi:hypothetical protein